MNLSHRLLFTTLFVVGCSQPSTPLTTTAPTTAEVAAPAPRFAVPITGLPTLGTSRTPLVTIVEFEDYDCPYCARAEATNRELRAKYGADLRFVVAERPLAMHETAREAALFALGANETGDFETAHDALFAKRHDHGAAALDALADDLHLGARFADARHGAAARSALTTSESLAAALGVRAIPTFFVNGRRITGAQPFTTFDPIVTEELEHARALVRGGVAPSGAYDAILAEARANPAPIDEEPAKPFVAEAKTAGGAHLYGAPDAPRTILLFLDFECPYCKKVDARLRDLVIDHPDVRVVLRHRPLPMHAAARLAAKAAIAAEAQGALAEMSALLLANQTALGRDALLGYADRLGLDRARFERDLDSSEAERRLADDEALAAKLEVKGTPTSFVDGRRVDGAQDTVTFTALLRP